MPDPGASPDIGWGTAPRSTPYARGSRLRPFGHDGTAATVQRLGVAQTLPACLTIEAGCVHCREDRSRACLDRKRASLGASNNDAVAERLELSRQRFLVCYAEPVKGSVAVEVVLVSLEMAIWGVKTNDGRVDLVHRHGTWQFGGKFSGSTPASLITLTNV
eukprot:scaffold16769_cov53-Phaeocystis_antarctica.AAC.1